MATITIDPLTRIEGHLKVDVTVENGVVTDARVSGTMARGIEQLLKGKDPRDATYVTERICGVCFGSHGWVSSLAVETAQGTSQVPTAARLLRNLIVGACWLHDHPLHFYLLSALDYLDLSVLKDYTGSDTSVQRMKSLIAAELAHPPVEGEYAGPWLPAYGADSYCVDDLDIVVHYVQSYLAALRMQAKAKKLSAIFGGKQPHQSGIIAGGVTKLPSLEQITQFRTLLEEQIDFINEIYVKDVTDLAKGPLYTLATSKVGVGYQNYLSFGGFPESDGTYLYPEGAIVSGSLTASTRSAIEPYITEDVTKAWYVATTGGHPSRTTQEFDLDKTGAYTFVKAPRFKTKPMEVGPLARMMVARKRPSHRAYSHAAAQAFRSFMNQSGVQPGAVVRHLARALETQMLCDAMVRWLDELENLIQSDPDIVIHDTAHWNPPATGQGYGMMEAPRGALGHWIRISDYKIDRYACVVPSTWNSSPIDSSGVRGPYEKALLGCPVPDANNPINVGRVIRSFDPCMACAVHILTPSGPVRKFIVNG